MAWCWSAAELKRACTVCGYAGEFVVVVVVVVAGGGVTDSKGR